MVEQIEPKDTPYNNQTNPQMFLHRPAQMGIAGYRCLLFSSSFDIGGVRCLQYRRHNYKESKRSVGGFASYVSLAMGQGKNHEKTLFVRNLCI